MAEGRPLGNLSTWATAVVALAAVVGAARASAAVRGIIGSVFRRPTGTTLLVQRSHGSSSVGISNEPDDASIPGLVAAQIAEQPELRWLTLRLRSELADESDSRQPERAADQSAESASEHGLKFVFGKDWVELVDTWSRDQLSVRLTRVEYDAFRAAVLRGEFDVGSLNPGEAK
jgi:hypothetical protein